MNIALVHDWLNQRGGAESVLEALVAMYPAAPVYVSMYAADMMPAAYQDWNIHTTWMDKLPGIYTHHQEYLMLYPTVFRNLDLSDYDVVLTNKSGFCHGVRTPPGAVHICYCLTPTRFVWYYDDYANREHLNPLFAQMLKPAIAALRSWDRKAAQGVDHFIAISSEIQQRIKTIYGRDSEIIHPPVDTHRFVPSAKVEDYFLVVSRLVPYKRVDLAVKACTQLGLPLLVAGSGREREQLEEIAGPTVKFLGRVPDSQLPDLMARCKAFLFPGLEDFGIAPVEAQAAGRPVVAFQGGGVLDSVIENETGVYFNEQSTAALSAALEKFDVTQFDAAKIRANAERFDVEKFVQRLTRFVEEHANRRKQAP